MPLVKGHEGQERNGNTISGGLARTFLWVTTIAPIDKDSQRSPQGLVSRSGEGQLDESLGGVRVSRTRSESNDESVQGLKISPLTRRHLAMFVFHR